MDIPASEGTLLERARNIAGSTLGDLARRYGRAVPGDLRRAKGWSGELIERALGASAASRPGPDFAHLGVELKTIPITRAGRPRESTYVCTVPLGGTDALTWESSAVRRKLARVLWIPLEAEPQVPIAQRRVGSPLLWSPDRDQETLLRADWEELMEMVCLGQLHLVTARHGTCLQIRPKAADSHARRWGTGELGDREPTLPRGFYLRTTFTRAILARHYAAGR